MQGQENSNQHTAGKQNKRKQQRRVFELTVCLSRIEGSSAEPKGNAMIPCRLREGNFETSSLTVFSCSTDIILIVLQAMDEYWVPGTCLWLFCSDNLLVEENRIICMRGSFFPLTLVWQSSKNFIRVFPFRPHTSSWVLTRSIAASKPDESHKMINDKNKNSLEMATSSNCDWGLDNQRVG